MIIVEDGTGVTTAESYATVAEADAYFAGRNNTTWAALDVPTKEGCLRLATDFMVENYRTRWKGYRSNIYQALDWPRKSVIIYDMAINYMVPFNVVPLEVKKACMEFAIRASTGPLAPDLTQGILHESAGPISTTYDNRTAQFTRYRSIDMLLRALLASTGAMTPIGRA